VNCCVVRGEPSACDFGFTGARREELGKQRLRQISESAHAARHFCPRLIRFFAPGSGLLDLIQYRPSQITHAVAKFHPAWAPEFAGVDLRLIASISWQRFRRRFLFSVSNFPLHSLLEPLKL